MPIVIPQTLIKELVSRNILSQPDADSLEAAAKSQDKDFGQILIAQNIISDDDLLKIKSELYKLPAMSLETVTPDKEALTEFPEDIVALYKIAPFGKHDSTMSVAVLNPEDIGALEALKFIAQDKNITIGQYLISYKDFEALTKTYGSLTGEVGAALETYGQDTSAGKTPVEEELSGKIEEITAEAPITKVVGAIVRHAVESRASDIHIEPFEDRVRIRFRIDGVLVATLSLPKNLHSAIVTRIKILTELKIDETRLAQDGRFSTTLNKRRVDFRVSTFPTKNGEKVVMRILDPLTNEVDLPELGLEGRSLEIVEKMMGKPFGSILITGPTGSGKSTTLASMLRRMNSENVNIVTLEDPIEYFVDGVNQSQVQEEIGYTFANGLRHILRQDPDIIMVGEIRDRETASLSIQAALTGHIVLSTLHTNDAMGVVPRLVDMTVERFLIPPTLNAAVAQRLLRRLCQTCRLETQANAGEVKIINDALADMSREYQDKYFSKSGYRIYKPNTQNPCKECGGKSYKGRIAIFEVLEMTDELEKIILTTLSESSMRQEAKRQGMITMFQDGILKILNGVISLEELLDVAEAGEST